MQAKGIAYALRNDPVFLIKFLVAHDPNAIADRLVGYGFRVGSQDDILDALNQLLAAGQTDAVKEVLRIDLRPERLYDPEAEQAIYMLFGAEKYLPVAGPTPDIPEQAGNDGQQEGVHWLDAFNQLVDGAVNVLDSVNGTPENGALGGGTGLGSHYGSSQGSDPDPDKKGKALKMVGGIVLAIVLVAGIVWAVKMYKRKAKK